MLNVNICVFILNAIGVFKFARLLAIDLPSLFNFAFYFLNIVFIFLKVYVKKQFLQQPCGEVSLRGQDWEGDE